MKKMFLLLLLLNSCSLNSNNAYWNENLNSTYEEINYDKDYTIEEYKKALDMYSNKTKIPDLN
tara:strand:- start:69 stop:257 length:189 start_codon:yes stop_codon:yes gene_type:complete